MRHIVKIARFNRIEKEGWAYILKSKSKLIYFLSETHVFSKDHSLLVVNLVGPLVKENVYTFQQCQDQISKSNAKCVVLNFRDVPEKMDSEFSKIFENIRINIHKRAGILRFSGLHPGMKEYFINSKILLPEEISNSLAEALQSFPVNQAA